MAILLNKCPVCGSKLEYAALQQYSNVYEVTKKGRLSAKRKRKEDNGSMECGFLSCTNEECNFCTDCDLQPLNHSEISIFQSGDVYMYEVKEQEVKVKKYRQMSNAEIRQISYENCPLKCTECKALCDEIPVGLCRKNLSEHFDKDN